MRSESAGGWPQVVCCVFLEFCIFVAVSLGTAYGGAACGGVACGGACGGAVWASDTSSDTSLGAAGERPNIVLIVSDDQAWTDYGFMGHPQIETPHLDRLARESAVFTRGYVPTALCRPALATLITGLYAHQHRVSGNDPALLPGMRGGQAEPPEYRDLRAQLIAQLDRHPTVPRLLAERGYRSFQAGKWWEGNFARGGFTAGMTRGFPQPGGRHGDDGLKIGRQGLQPMLDFMDESAAAEEPFFVWYAPFLPHTPHNPPERLLQKYLDKGIASVPIARYYAMVEWFDETCGELIGHLEQRDIRRNTLILYVGDNGWIQRADGDGFAPRSKQTSYEGGTRQPILFSWPGVIPPGERGEQLCSSVDLVPTLLAAAGAEVPTSLPGYNLLPVLQSGDPTPRDEVYGEGFAHDIADIDNPEASLLYRWVIAGRWKLLLTYDGQMGRYGRNHQDAERRPQLFDLLEDPHETQNQAANRPELVQELAGKLQAWWPVTQRQVLTEWPVDEEPQTPESEINAAKVEPGPHLLSQPESQPQPQPEPQPESQTQPEPEPQTESQPQPQSRPNVVMIAVDDLNDWVGCLGGHPQALTPRLDALAARGTLFTNAHCQAPLCNPSRTSVLLGVRPSTSGIYGLEPWFREVPEWREAVSLPQHFARAGYRTMAAGKIFHHGTGAPSRAAGGLPPEFQVRGPSPGIGVRPAEKLIPPTPMGNHPLMDWGVFPHRDEDKGDYQVASWAVEQIRMADPQQPFFLAAGFFLPHVPCYATPDWFDLYPEADLILPPIGQQDRLGTPRFSWYLHWQLPEPRLAWVQRERQWQNLVRSYLACTSFVDAQVGRLVDAIDEAGLADNTVIVLWSDHGYHLGEKEITGKNTLWERSTRVPLLFAGRGVAPGQRCAEPVELLDIYPTLSELCHLPLPAGVEGLSLVPQCQQAKTARERPAVTTHNPGNHAVRSRHYRYIRYADGSEELYDHRVDPHEWHNLLAVGYDGMATSDSEERIQTVQWHRRHLAVEDCPPVAGSAHRILTYNQATDEATWEGTLIRREDRVPD